MSGPAAHDQKLESKVLLDRENTSRMGQMDSRIPRYIQSAAPEGELDLLRALDEHRPIIKSLYDWVLPQFSSLHSGDLESANQLINDYNDVLTGGRGAQTAATQDERIHGERPVAYPSAQVADGQAVEEAIVREATRRIVGR